MRTTPIAALVLSGCWFGLERPERAPDAQRDAPATVCLGEGGFRICVDEPVEPVMLSNTIDTANCALVDKTATSGERCVFAGTTVTVTGTVRAIGPRPVVLFATGAIEIDGKIDLSSDYMIAGAGAASTVLCAGSNNGANNGNGGGGGGGGSFGTPGGNGGAGDNGLAQGGVAGPVPVVTMLHAGCAGGRGGVGSTTAFDPTLGGGAISLLAGSTIEVSGMIDASGGGGRGGNASKGGGNGGSSGGMIAMHAASIVVTGTLFANGGGGGGGADNGADGQTGGDPERWDEAAFGGIGGGGNCALASPGCGGTGAARTLSAQAGSSDGTGAGGGGGGGGAGIIILRAPDLKIGTMISPQPK